MFNRLDFMNGMNSFLDVKPGPNCCAPPTSLLVSTALPLCFIRHAPGIGSRSHVMITSASGAAQSLWRNECWHGTSWLSNGTWKGKEPEPEPPHHLRRLPNCDDLAYRAAEIVTAETAPALWLRNISLRLGAGVRFGLRNQFN